MRWVLLAVAGCGFAPASVTATGDAGTKDAPPGTTCFGSLEMICVVAPPQQASLQLDTPIVTTTDPRCDATVSDACVMFAGAIVVTGTVPVTGTRPLVLLATTSIMVPGTLDASSTDAIVGAAASSPACAAPSRPGDGNGLLGPTGNSGGGGAGGTFGAQGSSGTDGSTFTTPMAGSTAPPAIAIDTLRGGCPGGSGGMGGSNAGGTGGASGGAVYLIAATIKIDGKIFASGAKGLGGAGNSTGGGGGGSGGMIALEAATITIANGAVIAANGGGGAGGGGASQPGGDGANGTTTQFTQQAAGGGAGDGDAAMGGKGSTIGHLGGDMGSTANYGGGGGGGGAVGIVWTKGAISNTSRFSPPPAQH